MVVINSQVDSISQNLFSFLYHPLTQQPAAVHSLVVRKTVQARTGMSSLHPGVESRWKAWRQALRPRPHYHWHYHYPNSNQTELN